MDGHGPPPGLKAPLVPSGGHARRWDRYALELSAAVQILIPEDTFSAHIFVGLTRDLSLRGMRVTVEEVSGEIIQKMLDRPRYIRVTFPCPDGGGEIRVMGRIVHIEEHPPAGTAGRTTVGILLDPYEGVDLTAYERLVGTIGPA